MPAALDAGGRASVLARFTAGQLRGLVAALLVSLIGAGMSAQAGLSSLGDRDRAIPAGPRPTGYEAQDHFPGAAYFQLADDARQAPAAGATGTIALPDLPVPPESATDAADGSIHPARPFVLAGSGADRTRALECLTSAIYYEAANEPDDGQRAVAQVVLNRVRHPAFPPTVCGVVYQGSEKRGCQFSFACDGAMARAPARTAWLHAAHVAAAALGGAVFAPVGMATHYHTYAVTPAWNRSLVMTGMFGAHLFHRWKGWWGTPAAFSQAYRGGEPLPGPHAPILAEAVPAVPLPDAAVQTALANAATAAAVAEAQPARTPRTADAEVQPQHRDSGTVQDAYVDRTTPESTILDRWKDSGKPLR
jgi:spore germination cell wall hydrolase CwlJ-like protein